MDTANLRQPSVSQLIIQIILISFTAAIGLGLARFAYGLILPDMRESLHWSYAEAGFMNTANAVGYLIGAFIAASTIRIFNAFRVALMGALACVIGLAISSITQDFTVLTFARLLTGLGGAFGFVGGGTLATNLARAAPTHEPFLISLFYVGPGVGILISGVTIPPILEVMGAGSWWIAWGWLALLSAGLASAMLFASSREQVVSSQALKQKVRIKPMIKFLIGYVMYGMGGAGYFTFMIAWLQAEGADTATKSTFWGLLGFSSVFSPWIWRRLIGWSRGGEAAGILVGITAISSIAPLLVSSTLTNYFSAIIFGSATLAVVAATTAFVRKNYSSSQWPNAIGIMTTSFGIGLVAGPLAAGFVIDIGGTISAGLWTAVGWLIPSSLLMFSQRPIKPKSDV